MKYRLATASARCFLEPTATVAFPVSSIQRTNARHKHRNPRENRHWDSNVVNRRRLAIQRDLNMLALASTELHFCEIPSILYWGEAR